jgi:tRNA-specific 2-thiouridylase
MFISEGLGAIAMRVALLLSGGVDSSVALKLLLDEGHDVTAFYIKIWLEDELASLGSCPWEDDLKYCEATCKLLGVRLQVINLQQEYHERVVSYVLSEVKAGRTPNPDVMCNSMIKFGAFVKAIDNEGARTGKRFDKVASGHYAGLEERDGAFLLRRNPDPVKDQTYFLARLTQEQLGRLLFPLGDLTKAEVRALAKKCKFPAAERKDSQGICFLGKIPYEQFINFHCGTTSGDFVDADTGDAVGKHNGHWYYTAGQRQRIPVGKGPWYVVRKDAASNQVFISNKYLEPDKRRDEFVVEDVRWIGPSPKAASLSAPLMCKVRHGPTLYECALTDKGRGRFSVRIHGNDQGMAPGQFCVFYDGDYCVGSGVIC